MLVTRGSLVLLAIALGFIMATGCETSYKQQSKLKIVNLDKSAKKKDALKLVYYKEWNGKKNKPYGRVTASAKDKLNNYYEVGYNKRKQIETIVYYQDKTPFLSIKHDYSPRRHIRKKEVIQKSKDMAVYLRLPQEVADIKEISYYNPLHHKTSELIYVLESGDWYKALIKKYTGQGKLSRVDHLDSENRLMSYTNYKYQGDKLISKTAYSRDQKLSGSDEYYKLIFLDYVENYRPDGKIATKLWYHKDDAPNKLYWTDRYSYRGIHTYINSYNPKNKLIHEKVLISATGKVIISKIHEQN